MVIEKTMNKLLKFIVGYLSFLYSDYEAVISSTKIDKEHSSYNGVIYLKINDLIIKISLDRDQLFIDFKSTLHKKTDYFSHDLVWALITSKIKDELFSNFCCLFLSYNFLYKGIYIVKWRDFKIALIYLFHSFFPKFF
jgi:hypothetical protein